MKGYNFIFIFSTICYIVSGHCQSIDMDNEGDDIILEEHLSLAHKYSLGIKTDSALLHADAALELAQYVRDTHYIAEAYQCYFLLALIQNNIDQADSILTKLDSLELSKADEIDLLLSKANMLPRRFKGSEMISFLEEARALIGSDTTSLQMCRFYHAEGVYYRSIQEHINAVKSLLKASALVEEYDYWQIEVDIYNTLAILYIELGAYEQAIEVLQSSQQLAEEYGNLVSQQRSMHYMMYAYDLMEDYDRVEEIGAESVALKEKYGMTFYFGTTYFFLGQAAMALGKQDSAQYYYEVCLELSSNPNEGRVLGQAYYGLARVLAMKGQEAEALEHIKKSYHYFKNFSFEQNDLYVDLLVKAGDIDTAMKIVETNKNRRDDVIGQNTYLFISDLLEQQKKQTRTENELENRFYRSMTTAGILIASILSFLFITVFRNRINLKHNQALQDANEKIQAAANAKQEFLGIVSHELRTPMNAIMGFTELLKEDDPKQEHLFYLENLDTSNKQMLKMIDNILALLDLEAERASFEQVRFDLHELSKTLTQEQQTENENPNINIRLDADFGELPQYLIGDPKRLQQVLENLVSNAIKFTKEGFVHLSILLKTQDAETANLLFQVKDTGIGIVPEKQAAIFETFKQVSDSASRNYDGLGIGLPLAQRIVELHGSTIELESEVGKGSTFSFELTFPKASKSQYK